MPGGFSEPIGLLAFPAIKAAGYTLYALYLNSIYKDRPRNIFVVGISRMFLGLLFGTALAFLSFPFVFVFGIGIFVYLFGLIPVRVLEWYILIKGFYFADRKAEWSEIKNSVWLGVLTSFILDIPAIMGLVASAGFWIC